MVFFTSTTPRYQIVLALLTDAIAIRNIRPFHLFRDAEGFATLRFLTGQTCSSTMEERVNTPFVFASYTVSILKALIQHNKKELKPLPSSSHNITFVVSTTRVASVISI